MRALLTDTHLRTTWTVARSLARRGIEVVGLRARASAYDGSRAWAELVVVPCPEREPEAWLEAVRGLCTPADVLVPVAMPSLVRVAAHRERLEARVGLPGASQLALAVDKERTLAFARAHGIPAPPTLVPGSAEEAEKALRELGLPLVVKLREEAGLAPRQRYGVARSADAFRRLYRQLSARQPRPLVQRYVPGEGVGLSLLADRGRPLALFGHRRLREALAEGGPSTWCERFDSPELERHALRFAEASGWSGVAMLEFKRDPDSGTCQLLEINPRFWGSLPLAVACGVDFPALHLDWTLGRLRHAPPRRPHRFRRLKFPGADLRAFAVGLEGAGRWERWRRLAVYAAEWIDPRLRLAGVDLRDPELARFELARSAVAAREVLRRAL